jgi:hypothetical protein
MIFEEENVYDVREEIAPMLDKHYEEVAMYKDKIKLAVDWDKYETMEDQDSLRVYTLRNDEEKLVGYNVFFVHIHPHYMNDKYAVNDIVYIDPTYRHTENTIEFFNWCERMLEHEGVSVMTYHMKEYIPFHTLMKALDFDHAEFIYTKYIGK